MKKLMLVLVVMVVTLVANAQDTLKVYRIVSYSLGENLVTHGPWYGDHTVVVCCRDCVNSFSHEFTALLEEGFVCVSECSFIGDSTNNLALRVFFLTVTALSKINFDTDVGTTETEILGQDTFWTKTVQKGKLLFRKKTSTSGILVLEVQAGNVLVNWLPKTETGNLWSNRPQKSLKWGVDMKSFIVSSGEVNAFPNDIANLTEAEKTLKSFLKK